MPSNPSFFLLVLEAKRSERIRLELELKNVQRQIAMMRRSGRRFEVPTIIIPLERMIDISDLLCSEARVLRLF